MTPVFAVIVHEHRETGPERADGVLRMDVAAANGLEGAVVGTELHAEAGCVEIAETTNGSGNVERATEHAGIEMVVCLESEGGVKVF